MINKIKDLLAKDLEIIRRGTSGIELIGPSTGHAFFNFESRVRALEIALGCLSGCHYCGEPGVNCDVCEAEKEIARELGVKE